MDGEHSKIFIYIYSQGTDDAGVLRNSFASLNR